MRNNQQLHFIGVGGIGMSGLAKLALEKGYTVSGSDLNTSPLIETLIERGAKIDLTQQGLLITPEKTIIYSSGVRKNNIELQKAKDLGCLILHRSECLQKLIGDKYSIAVAGTHGKTGTSALLASVLEDPSYAIGGILQSTKTNAFSGKGDYFVLEADESDGSFINYYPDYALITNIDRDHMEYWQNDRDLLKGFATFSGQVKKALFVHESVPSTIPGFRYGLSENNPLFVKNIRQQGPYLHFDIQNDGKLYKDIQLKGCGSHIAQNALGVFGLCLHLGIDEEVIRQCFYRFKGVKRRLDHKWEANGALFIDDYAHHPVEIEATLRGLREMYPDKEIIALFQPHRYTRVKECLQDFNDAFQHVDKVVVTDIYSAGEPPLPGISSEAIAKTLTVDNSVVPRVELASYIHSFKCTNPLFITLGAGDITKLSNEVLTCQNGK